MESKRKHHLITLQHKLDVLKRLDNGESASKLAAEFNVGRATVCDWRKNRFKLEQFGEESTASTLQKRKTLKLSPVGRMEVALYQWFTQERRKGSPPSGPLIQEKAILLNSLMNGDASFTASKGWLDRWKRRHEITVGDLQEKLVSHADAAKALAVALRYVEQHADATPKDAKFMRRWLNIASTAT